MQCSRHSGYLLLAVVAVFAPGSAVPVHAEYHKAYRFRLPSQWVPEDVVAVRVITNAMEVVTDQYCGWLNPWGQGTVGYPVIGGVYNTRIAYRGLRPDFPTEDPTHPGVYWDWDDAIKLGWSVSDSDCRLRDLKWEKADKTTADVGLLAEVGSLPGGGELLWDPPEWPGKWVWRIHNDPPSDPEEPSEPIPVHGLEIGVFGAALPPEEIAEITEEGAGIFEKRAGDIDTDLVALREAVLDHDMPPGWINSLTGKIDNAVGDKLAGDVAYQPPNFDIDSALHFWGQAARHMRTFANQVRNNGKARGRKWGAPDEWADWADEIADAILILPGTQPPAVVTPTAELTTLQAAAPTEIPADLYIPPGGYVDIVLEDVAIGDAVVLHGDVTDSEGNILVEWAEQVVIPEELIPPSPPTITPVPNEEGYLYNPETVNLDVADDDTQYICWWIGEPEDEAATLSRDLPPISITIEDEGLYKLVYLAEDGCGNTSEPTTVTIEMDRWHEFGPTAFPISYLDTIPLNVWGVYLGVNSIPPPSGTPVSSTEYHGVYGHSGNALHFSQSCAVSNRLPNGTQVSSLTAYYTDGTSSEMEFVLGANTAEWAWERPGLNPVHDLPPDPPTYSWWTNQDSPNGEYYWGHYYYAVLPLAPEKTLWYLQLRLLYPGPWIAHSINAITLERPLR